jgi:hypothetical protein
MANIARKRLELNHDKTKYRNRGSVTFVAPPALFPDLGHCLLVEAQPVPCAG